MLPCLRAQWSVSLVCLATQSTHVSVNEGTRARMLQIKYGCLYLNKHFYLLEMLSHQFPINSKDDYLSTCTMLDGRFQMTDWPNNH